MHISCGCKLFVLISFQYLLGEDADNVDQFQVLAHPKVHITISLDILCSYMQLNRVNNKEDPEQTKRETIRFTSRLHCQSEVWQPCDYCTHLQIKRSLVQALVGDIVMRSWARHFTLTVPLSTQGGGGGNPAMD